MQPLDPLRFVLIGSAGWHNQHQQNVIDYLLEENRVLSDQLGSKRLQPSEWATSPLGSQGQGDRTPSAVRSGLVSAGHYVGLGIES